MPRKCWACDAENGGDVGLWLGEVVCHRCDEAYARLARRGRVVAKVVVGACMLATFVCTLVALGSAIHDATSEAADAYVASLFFTAVAFFVLVTAENDPTTGASCFWCATSTVACLAHPGFPTLGVDFLAQVAFWARFGLVCTRIELPAPSDAKEESKA